LSNTDIRVIIPAFNERNAVGLVIKEIPKNCITEIIVVDNGSSDDTFSIAQKAGATALKESKKGYGRACLAGMDYLAKSEETPDIVVFLDGDYSDYPEEIEQLIKPIMSGNADFVLGSRALGTKESGSMMPQQIFGNWLATTLMRWLYDIKFTDLGPFRAIRYDTLLTLNMQDKTYGWTIEMQIKAAKNKARILEIPVNYRKRIGISKVSGTLKGTLLAGYKIISTIFKYL
jgi:glycosyltransferase involved in cell wall biosynthesis|tara:strand:+ start:11304 stop:11996 length:693 start_codon:yes stop_codon:yes gene_type:complete